MTILEMFEFLLSYILATNNDCSIIFYLSHIALLKTINLLAVNLKIFDV